MTHNSGKETRTSVYVSVTKELPDGSNTIASLCLPKEERGNYKIEIHAIKKFIAGTFNMAEE